MKNKSWTICCPTSHKEMGGPEPPSIMHALALVTVGHRCGLILRQVLARVEVSWPYRVANQRYMKQANWRRRASQAGRRGFESHRPLLEFQELTTPPE